MQSKPSDFKLICFSNGYFQSQIICLSYESIYSYSHIIEQELQKQNIGNAKILIDQLLITGNTNNRFISIEFVDGNLIFPTAVPIKADSIYHQFTTDYLKKRKDILKNSILSSYQIALIEKGYVL